MEEQHQTTKLLDLPIDILLLIFPYLDAPSFLSLTATCRALHSTEILHDSAFWSHLVRRDFRVPNQPVVQNDGHRWQKLYKRLRTQAKIFTWGNNEKGCLGHSYETPMITSPGPGARRGRRRHVNWPVEMQGITKAMGVISDVQCGGWSTTMLTSKGALYMVGVMDGLFFDRRQPPYVQRVQAHPVALKFPDGYPKAGERYEPATALRQFSSGRAHVLALSDSGRIWTWHNADLPGTHVKFVHHETKEDGRERGRGAIKNVVAGWNKSAAYIEGSGIVIWEPLQMSQAECDETDTALVLETAVVPGTKFITSKHAKADDTDAAIGEVQSFIVLEAAIVFNTSLGKVFAAQIIWDDEQQTVKDPIELQMSGKSDDPEFVTDVQGSFQNFAIFTKAGAVLTSNLDTLMPMLQRTNAWMQSSPAGLFRKIPALQNKQVISLAFGDYHIHALHAPGHITSYGYEPQGCGALGLGGSGTPENRLRGIRNQDIGGDGHLVPHAYTEGRQVWFEEEKRQWVRFLTSGGVDQAEAAERIRLAIGSPDVAAQGEVSEWIEQQGRDWESKFNVAGDSDGGLGAYFALSVTAAGWHSGALVLVNETTAQNLSRAVEVPDAPPATNDIDSLPSHEEGPSSSLPPRSAPTPITSQDTSYLGQALDWGRYLLGLPPYNVSAASHGPDQVRADIRLRSQNVTRDAHHNLEPINYGASPRNGYKYVWADDHFPRLRLSNGTEMPGEVGFDEWRYGRPEWKLDWQNDVEQASGDD
ncbi:hypothetical protein CLAFUW4_03404 [Fulvia fulva]|uniref:F-box domain-containing protein n=1 Tax=Passalora fulva TaxID=5499 RepID=A0A9Q8LAL5_PASFU|nr:uncharacterized protein CLAFUR5_03385 [Fulvia fulva]KAK4631587.1 hypothetical protein CLAFUR4_03393 [Fulvia fulva]KAK4633420.1 hypothetical protein CLAFUR0_03398 [Fulvia fulva]UJO13970.1 hypothetical protein CLAFUR5_03385 [Fulvia fulva]WPV11330.1 hypothetical protein CLAFUW4_03404 [Fulvia fulva]WPV25930.1 hypothetical protein CLAFUW7_03396 [Fulvia fulva]